MLARQLGCTGTDTDGLLNCLRFQDTNRITQASYRVSDYFNGTDVFGPVIDSFLPKDLQYIARSPWEALERGEFPRIPVITGISSKDGLLMISKLLFLIILHIPTMHGHAHENRLIVSERRSQLYRMTPVQLKETFENDLIPQLLERSRLNRNWLVVKEVVKFAFITGASNDSEAVMDQLLDVCNA